MANTDNTQVDAQTKLDAIIAHLASIPTSHSSAYWEDEGDVRFEEGKIALANRLRKILNG
jgi:hypothetical protein